MIVKVSDYIVSPLAMGTQANYECVKAGKSRLRQCVEEYLPEPFMASMMDDGSLEAACVETGITGAYTKSEQMAILAAARALQETDIRPDSEKVLFILSTTKGNVGLLDERRGGEFPVERVLLTEMAKQVVGWFRNPNMPLVVCNACISGLSAQAEAVRALESRRYAYVVVIGVDVLSLFIVSGFQSLKALSDDFCRPFDEERTGLNLGEASACIIYGYADDGSDADCWRIVCSANRNDAFHVSGPSKTAEGAYRTLKCVLGKQPLSDLAFVNVHGTATLFNDEMEAMALGRAGLDKLPVNGLKGYFGHTMGASGVLETLISMKALEDGLVLGTRGFVELGVSRKINVAKSHRQVSGTAFLKMMSGFGGCNAAMIFRKGTGVKPLGLSLPCNSEVTHTVHVTEREALVDGEPVKVEGSGMEMLKALYHTCVGNYPKFYKMDALCKLGFIASELLLEAESRSEGIERFVEREDRAVVCIGRTASLYTDNLYQQTIRYSEDYYPSPSTFIYTLPNILTGEIAIRNHYHGETLYLLQDTPRDVKKLMAQVFSDAGTHSVIGGWVEMENTEHFEATLYILRK